MLRGSYASEVYRALGENPVLGDKFYIARDWEEMMEFRYGKDWRIPVAYTNYKVSFVQKNSEIKRVCKESSTFIRI